MEESQVLLIFSIVYLHVNDQITTNLDDNNKKMIFIGYYQKYKAYNLYNPNERKTVISIAIEFHEEGA